MICQKCKDDFPESEIQVSHDIPKYLGGTDKDGRHNLCIKCHKEYEDEVLRLCLMNYFKDLPEWQKRKLRFHASIVKGYFFKDERG